MSTMCNSQHLCICNPAFYLRHEAYAPLTCVSLVSEGERTLWSSLKEWWALHSLSKGNPAG
uniref:Uncharacterized protein n=1 Tax=Anguilla anguilla TaxID=7936 RepID=A0A0E9X2X3_ANGAN